MAWIEPKTDWTSSDYFNAEDYNRIIGNVIYLKAFSDALFNSLTNVKNTMINGKYSFSEPYDPDTGSWLGVRNMLRNNNFYIYIIQ